MSESCGKVETIDLTDCAKKIFGEIVKCAYVKQPGYGKPLSLICKFNAETLEPADGFPVIIEFNNGKKFKIWSSEWGGVTAIK